jgi:hypothetical protein
MTGYQSRKKYKVCRTGGGVDRWRRKGEREMEESGKRNKRRDERLKRGRGAERQMRDEG